jgi:hypothetical protein
MRPVYVFPAMAVMTLAVGCTWFGKTPEPARPTTPVPEYAAEKFVKYLNDRAGRLQTISARVHVSGKSDGLPFGLDGDMAVAQPKYFRMRGDGRLAGKFDLGSNNEQFWMYVDAPGNKPMFMYASHKDFEDGRARLPEGVAFEPEWVMQALGMHVFPTTIRYNVPTIDLKDRTYTVSWPATTPTGMPVTKEVVFDADDTRGERPQVKRHVIRDGKGKAICTAEVKSVATLPASGKVDPRLPLPPGQVTVQYPTHVVLHWNLQKFDLDLKLSDVHVNNQFSQEQVGRLFTLPNMSVQPINLAEYRLSAAR